MKARSPALQTFVVQWAGQFRTFPVNALCAEVAIALLSRAMKWGPQEDKN